MFTKKGFNEYIAELCLVEEDMLKSYDKLSHLVEDEDLRMQFTALLQEEKKHAGQLNELIELANSKASISAPEIKWTVKSRLALLAAVVIMFFVGFIGYAVVATNYIIQKADAIEKLNLVADNTMSEIQLKGSRQYAVIKFLSGSIKNDKKSHADFAKSANEFRKISSLIDNDIIKARKNFVDADNKLGFDNHNSLRLIQVLDIFEAKQADLVKATEDIFQLLSLGEVEIKDDLLKKMENASRQSQQYLVEYHEEVNRYTVRAVKAIRNGMEDLFLYTVSFLIGVVLVVLFLGNVIISRHVNNVISIGNALIGSLDVISSDETAPYTVEISGTDEINYLNYCVKTMVSGFSEILIRKGKLESELEYLNTTDRLTGLLNIKKCKETIEKEIARSLRYENPISIVMIEVENFNELAKDYDNESVNSMLEKLARILTDVIRNSDFVFRYDENRFLVLAVNTNEVGVKVICQKLASHIDDYTGTAIFEKVNINIGATQYLKGENVIEFIQRAENNHEKV
jgi:diguanylate cyclase (GGDEF)-like protein